MFKQKTVSLLTISLIVFASAIISAQATVADAQTAASVASMSVAPSSGFGLNQTFQFSYTDPNGYSDLTSLTVRIPTTSTQELCWVVYDTTTKALSLAGDSENWSYATIGSPGNLHNSQCTIDVGGSSAAGSGNTLHLILKLQFSSSFAGFKTIYMRAQNQAGTVSDLIPEGSWDVFTPPDMQAVSAQPQGLVGTHWAGVSDFPQLQALGYKFAVVTVNPSSTTETNDALAAAEKAGLNLIIGANPPPYKLEANGSWTISDAGITFLQTLAAHASVVQAIFVFNEPYWVDPATSYNNSCGAVSAAQLRTLRSEIQSIWPGAKIYHDIGDPQSWAPGGDSWQSCVGDKYVDQTGVADYVGIWQYPVSTSGYNRQTALDFAYKASRYVLNSMQPAQPVFLGQAFGNGTGMVMPTTSQLQDWNCAVRSVLAPGTALSWYVWKQAPLYSDFLANHPESWAATQPSACTQQSAILP
jgi:hypothetical protein